MNFNEIVWVILVGKSLLNFNIMLLVFILALVISWRISSGGFLALNGAIVHKFVIPSNSYLRQ